MKIRMVVWLSFMLLVSYLSYGQVGRHELPVDTIAIGGEQQEKKIEQGQGKKQLTKEMTALRDSVNERLTTLYNNSDRYSTNVSNAIHDRYKKATQELALCKSQLDKAIRETSGAKQWNADMNKRMDKLLKITREQFNRIRTDFNDE